MNKYQIKTDAFRRIVLSSKNMFVEMPFDRKRFNV